MRYTDNGTLFYKENEPRAVAKRSWAVQLNYTIGAGSPFKTIKWATWYNSNMPFGYQETNEPIDMIGWTIATDADLVLFGDQELVDDIQQLRALVRLGYKGAHSTPEILMSEIEWRMNV